MIIIFTLFIITKWVSIDGNYFNFVLLQLLFVKISNHLIFILRLFNFILFILFLGQCQYQYYSPWCYFVLVHLFYFRSIDIIKNLVSIFTILFLFYFTISRRADINIKYSNFILVIIKRGLISGTNVGIL